MLLIHHALTPSLSLLVEDGSAATVGDDESLADASGTLSVEFELAGVAVRRTGADDERNSPPRLVSSTAPPRAQAIPPVPCVPEFDGVGFELGEGPLMPSWKDSPWKRQPTPTQFPPTS
jgi:hypothetical protein